MWHTWQPIFYNAEMHCIICAQIRYVYIFEKVTMMNNLNFKEQTGKMQKSPSILEVNAFENYIYRQSANLFI